MLFVIGSFFFVIGSAATMAQSVSNSDTITAALVNVPYLVGGLIFVPACYIFHFSVINFNPEKMESRIEACTVCLRCENIVYMHSIEPNKC